MSSVSSLSNPGMTYLTKLLSSSGSPLLSSGMSSSQVQSVLKKASPGDLIKMSSRASQLKNLDSLFGTGTSQQPGLSPASAASTAILNSLSTGLYTPSPASASTTSSSASQISSNQKLQLQNLETLFGIGTSRESGLYSASAASTAILNSLSTSSYALQPASASRTSSFASQISNYASQQQAEEMQALFGLNSAAGAPGSLVNLWA